MVLSFADERQRPYFMAFLRATDSHARFVNDGLRAIPSTPDRRLPLKYFFIRLLSFISQPSSQYLKCYHRERCLICRSALCGKLAF